MENVLSIGQRIVTHDPYVTRQRDRRALTGWLSRFRELMIRSESAQAYGASFSCKAASLIVNRNATFDREGSSSHASAAFVNRVARRVEA